MQLRTLLIVIPPPIEKFVSALRMRMPFNATLRIDPPEMDVPSEEVNSIPFCPEPLMIGPVTVSPSAIGEEAFPALMAIAAAARVVASSCCTVLLRISPVVEQYMHP